jgi:hypothetical protein
MSHRPRLILVPGFALLLTLLAGCGNEARMPTAPPSAPGLRAEALNRSLPDVRPGDPAFYPLAVGNRWTYRGEQISTVHDARGKFGVQRSRWTREAVISSLSPDGGAVLAREDGVIHESSGDYPTTRFLRQDASGLVEIDIGVGFETRLLFYPLRRGLRWVSGASTWEVENLEMLTTPAGRFGAWRIHVTSPWDDEDGLVWYGRVGILGMQIRKRFQRPDPFGNLMTIEEVRSERLESAALAFATP